MRNQVELAFPYKILTYSGISTKLNVNSTLYDPAIKIKSYKWDMYSNGKTLLSTAANSCEYRYTLPGTYRTTVTALLSNGYRSITSFTVEVASGTGVQSRISENKTYTFSLSAPSLVDYSSLKSSGAKPKDGIVTKYALLVSGDADTSELVHLFQSETIKTWNSCLTNDFGFKKDDIYYLDGDLTFSPDVDAISSIKEFGRSFEAIRDMIDEDDLLFIWIADHGHGYKDPAVFDAAGERVYSGEFSTRLIPNGTEKLESDIKMKATHVWNPYSNVNSRFPGLNKWILVTFDTSEVAPKRMYRIKFGNFDNDKFIEVVADYLAVDANEDGIVSNSEFATAKNAITLGDDNVIVNDNASMWKSKPRIIIDNYHQTNTDHDFQPYITFKGNGTDQQKTTVMFDNENDNKLDIAVIDGVVANISGLNPAILKVAGTDTDNDGLIDGVDLSGDGDKTDRFDFDENIFLLDGGNSPLYASEFNDMLNSLRCKNIIIGLEACFSGGFIHHISAPCRVVMTITQDRYWGFFLDGWLSVQGMSLLDGYRQADKNRDGVVTMLEFFNFSYSTDNSEIHPPQYNDNGDGKMYTDILTPSFNAGCLGNILSLNGYQKTEPVISNKTVGTSTDYSGTSLTLSHVKITPSGTVNLHQMTGVPGQISLSSLVVEKGGRLVIDNAFCK